MIHSVTILINGGTIYMDYYLWNMTYEEFGEWLINHMKNGGKITDNVQIMVEDISYDKPIHCMEAYNEA